MAEMADKADRSPDVQIYVTKTGTAGFEVLEMLDARPEWSRQPKTSKLKFHIWTYAKGGGEGSGQEHAEYYIDTTDFKALARGIAKFSPFGYSPTPGAEDRLLFLGNKGTAKPGAEPRARILELLYRPSRDYPFEIIIKNGLGRRTSTGAVPMVKVETRTVFRFSQFDFMAMCGELLDWVLDWEVRHHSDRREARTVIPRPR